MSLLVCAILLSAGPLLDVTDGAQASMSDRQLLPSGRNLGAVMDTWFVEVTSLQYNGGGMAAFDPLQLSAHGRSYRQTRYLFNGLEMTDPGRPGEPLWRVPHLLWDRLRHVSLWTARPGTRMWASPQGDSLGLVVDGGIAVGGGLWLPPGFMDREPAWRTGANRVRRELQRGGLVFVDGSAELGPLRLRLAAEHRVSRHRYPTLLDQQGERIVDRGRRTTVVALGEFPLRMAAVSFDLVWQGQWRSHEGAAFRLPVALTRQLESDAAGVRVAVRGQSGAPPWWIRGGWGFAGDRQTLNEPESDWVLDIEQQWLWLRRPEPPGILNRHRWDVSGGIEPAPTVVIEANGFAAVVREDRKLPPWGRQLETYIRAVDPRMRALSVTEYAPAQGAERWHRGFRLQSRWQPRWGMSRWEWLLALDHSAVGAPGGTQLSFVSPAAGVAVRWPTFLGELSGLLRLEPELLTDEAARFVDPHGTPSGVRRHWYDDGDLRFEPGERGEVLNRTGGAFHRQGSDLRRPAQYQLALGWRSPRFGPFEVAVKGAARVLSGRLTVRYDQRTGEGFRKVAVQDPGGDGLGEDDARTQAFARQEGRGEEWYELINATRPDFFVGAHVQLRTVETSHWFLNLGLAGYWDIGSGAYGLYADRNDAGTLDEVTADPNHRVNQRGRFDSDRAFGVHLLAGIEPWPNLSLAGVLRYRDGEPMTRFLVVEDLPQGPTAIMAVPRGDPVPRFTFHMTLDVRLRYEVSWRQLRVAARGDVLNLLGSATEIAEDPRTGTTYRRSLEVVPPRTVWLGVELAWGQEQTSPDKSTPLGLPPPGPP